MTPAAQSRAKVLNICADNAGGGSMVIVRRWKSGGEWTHPAAQHADWTSGKRHRDTARLSNGRRAFDRLLRGPLERGPQRRVTRLSPAFPSPDTVGGYISVNNRNITGQRPDHKIWDARDTGQPGQRSPGWTYRSIPTTQQHPLPDGVLSAAEPPRGCFLPFTGLSCEVKKRMT